MNTTEEVKKLKREEWIRQFKSRIGERKEREREKRLAQRKERMQKQRAKHTAIRKEERQKARAKQIEMEKKAKKKEKSRKKVREKQSQEAKKRWDEGIGEKMRVAREEARERAKYDPKKKYSLEELELQIGEKKAGFARSYIIDHNKRKALTAGGYKIHNVTTQTAKILKDAFVGAYIKMLQEDIERTCGISKHKNVQELSKMAFTNIADFHKDWYTLEEFDALTPEQKAAIKSITRTENKYGIAIKVELHDKKSALDSLNKMLGYNAADKVEVDGEVNFGEDVIGAVRDLLGIEKVSE